ncbi:Tannase/feruloyl esterase [Stachybotrys elegans]|uniref:Carboxylic ester hydrolase n=1 Tax=Stachybotrys elegans TaxID=80388 RepID=A0A8K0WKB1_9HYPO|nr:Tannase/feruloyl esterase [Stachybotrys elegans]
MAVSLGPDQCSSGTFTAPALFGAEILGLKASTVQNFTRYVSDQEFAHNPEVFVQDAAFCNVTVTYTHPGQNDVIIVETWLPFEWNGRLQAVGGGGWTTGRTELTQSMMAGALSTGYATSTTDGGFGHSQTPIPWALLSPGNVNLYALQNMGSVTLRDQAMIAKALIRSFYGQPPEFSYFNGCSHGGRQGYQLAQRYPDAYDGIAASAPAIYWSQFLHAMLWPQVVMKSLGQYPRGCELDYIQSAVISLCDDKDGVSDGIIMDPDACEFEPSSLIGTSFYCREIESDMAISEAAATVAAGFQRGARGPNDEFLWHGPNWGSNSTTTIFGTPGLAATLCENSTCSGLPFPFGLWWAGLFIDKDPNFDFASLTAKRFAEQFHLGFQEYTSIIGTTDPDLTLFQRAGGKMVTYHGLNDELTPSKGTRDYYEAVTKITPDVHSFYRFFEVPGLGHCYGGNGGQPTRLFEALRAWVEEGIAPQNVVIDVPGNGSREERVICPYPQKVRASQSRRPGSVKFYCSSD